MSDEQIAAMAECLNRHGVDYILIGGGAALLHGAPIARTRDADIVPDKQAENLDRLASALREIEARLWVGPEEPEGLKMTINRTSLGQIDSFLGFPQTVEAWWLDREPAMSRHSDATGRVRRG
ncbi:MAG TPA: hypothetical protein VE990_00410 [Acidimicrobiales bacterium]|nr:hypothetical protein [Acidimicrobiales bacterium]